ncbi:MAG: hypothetical protein WBM37_12495 [Nitrososphaeraceae archaeon]
MPTIELKSILNLRNILIARTVPKRTRLISPAFFTVRAPNQWNENKYSNRQIVQTLYDTKFLQQRNVPKVCSVIEENFSVPSIVDFEK